MVFYTPKDESLSKITSPIQKKKIEIFVFSISNVFDLKKWDFPWGCFKNIKADFANSTFLSYLKLKVLFDVPQLNP